MLPDDRNVEYLGGAGGFSGAQIWKITTAERSYCLRRWPLAHPDPERLDWINLVLIHASGLDCPFLATPIESNSGRRYVSANGFLWELTPWMPGKATFEDDPNDQRLEHVMTCLAKFHLASAQVNLGFQLSQNVAARLAALHGAGSVIQEIQRADTTQVSEPIDRLCKIITSLGTEHAHRLADRIEPFTRHVFPVQPVIRDVWHDHLLFQDNELTGLIDYGAMQMDNVALDLSRALGSLVGSQPARWSAALQVYSNLRQLSPGEIELVFALDQSAPFLSGLNWLKWILLERRSFESDEQVGKRIRFLIDRLTN